MSLFVVFIFGAVLLGAGAMLSPAWRTAQPRIGLCAALCQALVSGGAVFYTEAFGWDTLVIDYLLFALLSGVVLGGTLSTAQARAEARGERLADRDLGWPGPADLAVFALVALIVILPLLHLDAPLGARGQLTALHSLAARDGQSFKALGHYAPETTVIIAPGFHALSAYLSQQLSLPVPLVQLSVSAVFVFLLVWLAYDLGAELRDKRLGRALALAQLLCGGLHFSLLDGHASELMALLFLQALLLYALRLLRKVSLADLVAGGLMMGAVIYTSLSLSLVMLFGWLSLLALVWLSKDTRISYKTRLGLTLGLPAVALLGIAPWLFNNWHLIAAVSPSPFNSDIGNIALMTRSQGFIIVPLALYGMWRGLRTSGSLRQVSLLMLAWLLLVVDAAMVGALAALIPGLGGLINTPNIARHGLILPYTFFGGLALLHIWDERIKPATRARLRRLAPRLLAVAFALLLLAGIGFQPMLNAIRPLVDLPPATLNEDELAAMTWLRENAPADALLVAVDGNAWLPVFAERPALDFQAARYFEWDFVSASDRQLEQADFILSHDGDTLPANVKPDPVFVAGTMRVYESLNESDD